MAVKGIRWLGVCAEDFDATVAFYRDVVGLPVGAQGPQSGASDPAARFAALPAPDGSFVEVFSAQLDERDLFRAPMTGFLVDSVPETRAAMESRGAVFLGPVGRGGRFEWSYFRAPGGHVHQILSERSGPA